jgi:hypothetical protein
VFGCRSLHVLHIMRERKNPCRLLCVGGLVHREEVIPARTVFHVRSCIRGCIGALNGKKNPHASCVCGGGRWRVKIPCAVLHGRVASGRVEILRAILCGVARWRAEIPRAILASGLHVGVSRSRALSCVGGLCVGASRSCAPFRPGGWRGVSRSHVPSCTGGLGIDASRSHTLSCVGGLHAGAQISCVPSCVRWEYVGGVDEGGKTAHWL